MLLRQCCRSVLQAVVIQPEREEVFVPIMGGFFLLFLCPPLVFSISMPSYGTSTITTAPLPPAAQGVSADVAWIPIPHSVDQTEQQRLRQKAVVGEGSGVCNGGKVSGAWGVRG